ncbi:MAG: endonuclease/exonuclease/phosphatase family protein [Flavobacteriaceae bacterium]|nr:endonuclease/exonuclease/phosphatase family protein [Flavobacteriaceae bacterium]
MSRLLSLLVLISLVNYIVFKDVIYLSSLIFYVFPLPVILGVSFLNLMLNIKTKKKVFYAFISILILVFWMYKSYIVNHIEDVNVESEVVYWNAAKKRSFIDAFAVSETIPDVLVLVEYDQTDKQLLNKIKSKFAKYHFKVIHGKIGVFSKCRIRNIVPIKMGNNSFMVKFKTKIKNKEFSFYAIDITANIKFFRKHMLEEAFGYVITTKNTIIVGDFNTPYESLHFEMYRQRFKHAFTEKGNGFLETWMWNLPILSLDHVWVSKDLKLRMVNKINTWESDHAMLKIQL